MIGSSFLPPYQHGSSDDRRPTGHKRPGTAQWRACSPSTRRTLPCCQRSLSGFYGIHTGKYQITVYRDPSSGNNRYTNKAHQGPTRGIYQNYSNRASLRFYIKFCTSTYPSNKGLANCNTSEINLNARDTRYINPKVLTSAVEREGVADGGTGGSGTRPSLNTGPDFPPSRGVFSLVSDAFV